LLWRPAAPEYGAAQLTILDVGQGLASVVRTRSHVLIYDTGPAFRSGRDTGEVVVIPYLHSQGIRAVDKLMVSHGDLDHQGGMNSILQSLPVRHLLVGPSVTVAPGVPAELCRVGQAWQWDGVAFEVLHPAANTAASDNDSSCVLRIQAAAASALLTGDIQSDAEHALVERALQAVDVVVVPHHGSRTSSTAPFVNATSPQFAVFAAGYRNRWGFPKTDVIERWLGQGARTLSTVSSGAITIELAGQPPQAHEYRVEHPQYWRAR
jgi:competence protein ComEC